MGRRWSSGVGAVLLAIVAPLTAQAPPPPPAPVAGTWIMRLTLPVGEATPSVTFETKGDELSGVYSGRYGNFPISGRVLGRVVTFTFQMGPDAQPVTVCFTGEWTERDGTLEGTATLGELGQGTWTAARDPDDREHE
jgi:hypothetical protein